MEAVFRVKQGSMYEILSILECNISSMEKIAHKRRLNIELITEFVRLKLQVWETQGDTANLTHLLNSIDVSKMRSLYKAISLRELRSAAKVNSSDTMLVLQSKVFPTMVRDVPFVLLQKVAQLAFDIDLFPEDEDRFRASYVNSHIPAGWFSENPIHKWSENNPKSHSSLSSLPSHVDHLPDHMHVSLSQAVAVSYEAPWVMPTASGKDHLRQSSSGSSSRRRPSLVVPARALKMEGRRQSYKPSPSDEGMSEKIKGALCVIPNETEDGGFTISRGVLDAMRDWQHEETQPKPVIAGGFNEVLEDLLHSPSQPCTRVPTPVKSPRKRSARGTPVSTKRMKKTASPPSENHNPNHSYCNSVGESIIGSLLLDSGSTSPPCTSNPARLIRVPRVTQSERAIRKHIRDMDDYHKLNIF